MKCEEMRLVIATGPTREWIDPVRYISNPSTGRTGWALACAARDRFREIVYIVGPVSERYSRPAGVRAVSVETTSEMAQAVQSEIGKDTLLIMAAAPADYAPVTSGDKKIKKSGNEGLTIELAPTVDILKSIKERAAGLTNFWRVGFAAETHDVEEYARKKLEEKDLDFICANEVFKSRTGFGENRNQLSVINRSFETAILGPSEKEHLASELLDYIIKSIPDEN